MYVIIVGAGRVGTNIIEQLQGGEINVGLIELDRNLAEEVSTKYGNIIVFNGSATDPSILEDASVTSADFFITVTGNDEANIFSAILAKTKNPKIKTIVRINNKNSRKIIEKLEDLKKYFDVIVSPEDLASEYILKYILAPTQHRIPMFEGDIEILKIEYDKNSELSGKNINEINIDGVIVAFEKNGKIVLVNEEKELPENGVVYVVTRRSKVKDVEAEIK